MAKPLLDIVCIEEPHCDYPIAVKLTMDDGTVQTYTLDNKQDIMFQKVMDSLSKMKVGYQYQPEKRRRHRRG